ncbi:MAG TPA: dTDP-glucose 4,6-dehydratase [Polyangiaceae bacterium]|nr:dTDP-glucose 4,6-dehydratase [Polyangiaceae bacterium]
MIVLVTGGAGFIGSNFLQLSAARYPQHSFVNVDKLTYAANSSNLAALEGTANYVFERVDIAEYDALLAVTRKYRPELVVHFAAETHVDRSIHGPREFIRTNVEGTFNLLEACRSLWSGGHGLFHHVSTDEVYGSTDTGCFDEASPYRPSSPYAASKAASDHLVRAYAKTYELPIKISTSTNNYGPYQFPEKLIPLMISNALERRPLPVYGRGTNVRDWLYVMDHCEALWAVIEHGRIFETYNVGASCQIRNIDLVQQLCAALAEETRVAAAELLGLITFVEDRPGHDLRYALDARKIARECGWAARESFESGLVKTIRWYLNHPDWLESVRTGEYRRWLDQNYAGR